MLPNNLNNTTEESLNSLVTDKVSERRTVEFKLTLPGSSDEDKKEFLSDVSSFANTVGGDVVYGIKSENGVAIEVCGIEIDDVDGEKLRLESIISSGLRPRIEISLEDIKLASNKYVIVIRVKQSFIAPHRVVFKRSDRFYARNSAGKYDLDVEQLRSLFLQSSAVEEEVKNFHIKNLLEIGSGEGLIPVVGDSKVVIHIIPRESFLLKVNISQNQINSLSDPEVYKPMDSVNGWDVLRVNLRGWKSASILSSVGISSYLQVLRNGVIESVSGGMLSYNQTEEKKVYTYLFEKEIINNVDRCLRLLNLITINCPVYVFITLLNVKGFNLSYSQNRSGGRIYDNSIPKNVINLPEAVFENFEQNVASTLKPSLDILWNACGIDGSLNFDADGNWVERS